jgi:hypothetical protein
VKYSSKVEDNDCGNMVIFLGINFFLSAKKYSLDCCNFSQRSNEYLRSSFILKHQQTLVSSAVVVAFR